MAKVIINIDSVSNTYAGQEIAAGASYTIQGTEHIRWANDDLLMTHIAIEKAKVNDGTSDIVGVANQISYLKDIDVSPRDSDDNPIVRMKAARTGWTYHITAMEFESSVLGSLYHKDVTGADLNEATIKFYNESGTELTTQGSCDTDCVKTVIAFEPTWNYEIIGGTIKSIDVITENVRVWVVAVPDISYANGGSKVMAQCVNLKFVDPDNGIEVDGRASKLMKYSATYHTNKLAFTFKHPAGFKVPLMIAFEAFRA